jgi:hypothetical protein
LLICLIRGSRSKPSSRVIANPIVGELHGDAAKLDVLNQPGLLGLERA